MDVSISLIKQMEITYYNSFILNMHLSQAYFLENLESEDPCEIFLSTSQTYYHQYDQFQQLLSYPKRSQSEKIVEFMSTGGTSQSDDSNQDYMEEIFCNNTKIEAERPTVIQQKEKKQRKTNNIEYDFCTEHQRLECLRGTRFQTQNLGKHLQTQTLNYLKIIMQARQFEKDEILTIQQFNKSNGSLCSFSELFKCKKIREKCLQFYTSKDFVSKILKSTKMDMKKKIMMIKYLERMRSTTYDSFKKWKL